MEELCDIVRNELNKTMIENERGWRVSSDGECSCLVKSCDVNVRISIDHRDRQVTSYVIFRNQPESITDKLYTHIIEKLFPDSVRESDNETCSLEFHIRQEITSIIHIIQSVEHGSVSARDLFYFQRGYNVAYNDYIS